MKKGLTELVFILDKSGSMCGLEKDTVGGYNSVLEKQKSLPGSCTVTTVFFNSEQQLLHDRIDIRAVKPITEREYYVGGATALLDAIGMTVEKIANAQKNTAEDFRAEKVMFVIITDGEENDSRKYSLHKVKKLIENQKKRYNWEFIFLGANIDAVKTAENFGISPDRAVDYVPDNVGTALNFKMMNETVTAYRCCGTIPEEAFETIRKDVKHRGGKRK